MLLETKNFLRSAVLNADRYDNWNIVEAKALGVEDRIYRTPTITYEGLLAAK
jgi:hypothetical protein